MKRIGVVGIVLKGDRETVMEMQSVLSDFADRPHRGGFARARLGAHGKAGQVPVALGKIRDDRV